MKKRDAVYEQEDGMKNRIAGLIVISVVLVMALSACGLAGDMKAVNDLGDSFMTALRDGDADSSWEMLADNIKTEVGDATAWVDFVTPRNFSDWNFSNTQVNNDSAQLDGEATLGEDTYDVVLVFNKINDVWLISGINFSLQN